MARGYKPSLAEWVKRQTDVAHDVLAHVEPGGLVVVEAPSHGSRFGNPHERAGLWWRVVQYLVRRGDLVATVAPKTRAKYATGDGNADKRKVLAAMPARYPFVHVRDDNLADGLALAALGWRALGRPVEAIYEKSMDEAVRTVRWPEEVERAGTW
ncbi:hypothetical protein [Microbacterium sp. KNMS]